MSPDKPQDGEAEGTDQQPVPEEEFEYAMSIIRRYAEQAAPELKGDKPPGGFLKTSLDAYRRAFNCDFHLFASQTGSDHDRRCKIIESNFEDASPDNIGGRKLVDVFKKVMKARNRVWGEDITVEEGQVDFVASGMPVNIFLTENKHLAVNLLLLMARRSKPLDPKFPKAKFQASDKLLLRGAALHVAQYVQHEHWTRRSAFNEAQEYTWLPVRLKVAEKLLDFNEEIGLVLDQEVLKGWLTAEKDAFLKQESRKQEFSDSLKKAKRWLETKEVQDSDRKSGNELQWLLYECHLALLTMEGGPPLLDKRIDMACKAAGLPPANDDADQPPSSGSGKQEVKKGSTKRKGTKRKVTKRKVTKKKVTKKKVTKKKRTKKTSKKR